MVYRILSKKLWLLMGIIFFTSISYATSGVRAIDSVDQIPTTQPITQTKPTSNQELHQPDPIQENNSTDNLKTGTPLTEPSSSTTITQPAALTTETGLPIRLKIPSIGVDAKIEHIGLTTAGAVGVPEGGVNVSWFDQGPRPGQMGSALISGHYGIWRDKTHSVFDSLDTLQPGDLIEVTQENGQTVSFQVQGTKVYSKDDMVPELFNKDDAAYLNIITCHGQYLSQEKTYSQRFVVFAKLI